MEGSERDGAVSRLLQALVQGLDETSRADVDSQLQRALWTCGGPVRPREGTARPLARAVLQLPVSLRTVLDAIEADNVDIPATFLRDLLHGLCRDPALVRLGKPGRYTGG